MLPASRLSLSQQEQGLSLSCSLEGGRWLELARPRVARLGPWVQLRPQVAGSTRSTLRQPRCWCTSARNCNVVSCTSIAWHLSSSLRDTQQDQTDSSRASLHAKAGTCPPQRRSWRGPELESPLRSQALGTLCSCRSTVVSSHRSMLVAERMQEGETILNHVDSCHWCSCRCRALDLRKLSAPTPDENSTATIKGGTSHLSLHTECSGQPLPLGSCSCPRWRCPYCLRCCYPRQ